MEAVPGPGGRWLCRAAHPELPGVAAEHPLAIVALDQLEARIGVVKPGYYADLLVVRGDPVSSITAIRSVALVIKSGRIVFAGDPGSPLTAGIT
jgi:hypothetical protein